MGISNSATVAVTKAMEEFNPVVHPSTNATALMAFSGFKLTGMFSAFDNTSSKITCASNTIRAIRILITLCFIFHPSLLAMPATNFLRFHTMLVRYGRGKVVMVTSVPKDLMVMK
jgi:hypothetical protein